jgi:hypothetical protein
LAGSVVLAALAEVELDPVDPADVLLLLQAETAMLAASAATAIPIHR